MSCPETMELTKTESAIDHIKTVLQDLNDHSAHIKNIIMSVRNILKDSERQNKEIEKLRNKRSRNKAERSVNSLPSGITKPVAITVELATFLGVPPGTLVPRNEVTKGVSSYVKKFELYDTENKQRFDLSNTSKPETVVLKTLLGNPTEVVTYFNLQRYLKHHYIGVCEKDEAPPSPKEKVPEVVEVVVPPSGEAPKKKIIMVKKKKPQQEELTEE